jgi:hypothetical protein
VSVAATGCDFAPHNPNIFWHELVDGDELALAVPAVSLAICHILAWHVVIIVKVVGLWDFSRARP